MATHSSIRAWKIPWSEEPGGLPSMGFKKSDTTENSIVLIVKLEIGYHWSFNLVFLQYCVGYFMEDTMDVPQKRVLKLQYDSANPLLNIYSREAKSLSQNRYAHCCVHCRIVYGSQKNGSNLCACQQMNNKDVTHTHTHTSVIQP